MTTIMSDDDGSDVSYAIEVFFKVLFVASFIPYLLPEDMQPDIYKSPPPIEIAHKQEIRRLNNIVGGDSTRLGLFDLDEKNIN
jgi:hypothetical protein